MGSSTRPAPLSAGGRLIWTSGRIAALVVTVAVLAGLIWLPDTTLRIAWFGIVPVLPASFLINAGLWRGVCPIATANMMGAPAEGSTITNGWQARSTVVSILLLGLLVPARRLLLNQNGEALAVTLAIIVILAFVLGRFFRAKAGFCNSICPILPVEKLYGQSPLIWVRNARCVPCSHCTVKGCMDLDERMAVSARTLNRDGRKWLMTPFGMFATAFPGFILGYFGTEDAALGDWLQVYAAVLWPALISLVGLGSIIYLLELPSRIVVPCLGAAAVGIYYWYAGPASAAAFELDPILGLGLRWGGLALVAVWLVRAVAENNPMAGAQHRKPATQVAGIVSG